jgi:alkylation response protein AidB-like acyl-CoA dehydrogenase
MWRPKVFGGLEVDPMTAFRVFEEVSRLDSAAGWNLQLSVAVDPFGAWFPDEGAREVFGDPEAVLGGAFFPPRRAVPVKGGYRVTGQTPFVSGAHQCRWFFGLANIFDGDVPRVNDGGEPVTLITACPADEAQILDTWHTLGMRGTGSHDVVMTDVFVPERRTAPLVPLETPGTAYGGPLYRFTIWASVAALAPVATGIARAAIDDLLDLATRKTPAYTGKTLRDRPIVQSQIAQAEAKLGAARAYLYEGLQQVWEGAMQGRTITVPHKIKLQLAAIHGIIASAEAVDLVHAAAGTTGIRTAHRFQRHFRDVHTITQHGYVSASRYESTGQLLLGLNSDWPFFAL